VLSAELEGWLVNTSCVAAPKITKSADGLAAVLSALVAIDIVVFA
jgi:hypothetical protein